MSGDLERTRNIGIIAHIDAGKTTLSERILFYTDRIHRMGEVHEGAATMDFMPEEQERGITIASACGTCTWNDATINIIDTPGHVDFTIEVERALRVLDGAVGVFCAVGGVEPQSETVWRQSEKFHIPKLAFVNKLDRLGANFPMVLDAMRRRLGATPVPVTIPLGEGEAFRGVIDLVAMESLVFDNADQGRSIVRSPLAGEEADYAAPWREKLLEAVVENDDILLQTYLSGEPIDSGALCALLRKATLERLIVPVFAGAALRNIGVQPLLDGIVAYLPSPLDTIEVIGEDIRTGERLSIAPEPTASLAALVFKVYVENSRKLALVRLYAGTIREGDACRNITQDVTEKIGRIFRMQAGRRENMPQASAGSIVAVQGLRSVRTGDSLALAARPVLLEKIDTYIPVISLALEPKNTKEGHKLDEALDRFCIEDPTLRVSLDEASGQRIVSGMGELHLEVLLDRMKRENDLTPRSGNPQVVYRETIRKNGAASGEFDRELGNQFHYGLVTVNVAPAGREGGTSIDFSRLPVAGDARTRQLREALQQGLSDALQSGPLGYAVQDVSVTVLPNQGGDPAKAANQSAPGMRMAAAMAVKDALRAGDPALLEPVMKVTISVPEAMVGSAVSLLNTRAGRVESIGDEAGYKQVIATAPMRHLFGFSTALRSATQGRAGMMLTFDRFDLG